MDELVWKQDAIDALACENPTEPYLFYDDAVKAIKELPPAQPEKRTNKRTETHECDLISRQDAIDYCYRLINVEYEQGSDEMNYGQERVNQTETILHHLEFMPPAQPERDIPRKPASDIDHTWGIPRKHPVCPNCDVFLQTVHFIGDGKKKISYCDRCGQAIDWSEWEVEHED